MIGLDAAMFEDAEALQEWLANNGFAPYVDFEILTVTLSDGGLEVDPMGDLKTLLPFLREFAARHGYEVQPLVPK